MPKPSISGKFDVNGNQMALDCYGSGSPTIILENAHGVNKSTWDLIIPHLAAKTQVCAYDRINAGASTRTSNQRTMAQAADEPNALLKAAKIAGPYILAGHSFGGFFVLTYAEHNPQQIAGVVLVDASYLDECKKVTLKAVPTPSADESAAVARLRGECKPTDEPWKLEGIVDIDPAVRAVKSLGDIPLAVLVQGSISKLADMNPGVATDLVKQMSQLWQEVHKEYAELSTDSTFIIAENSGHFIHKDEPQLVIDAILGLVDKARQK